MWWIQHPGRCPGLTLKRLVEAWPTRLRHRATIGAQKVETVAYVSEISQTALGSPQPTGEDLHKSDYNRRFMITEYWNPKCRRRATELLEQLTAEGIQHNWTSSPSKELLLRALASSVSRAWPSGRRIGWADVRAGVNACIRKKQKDLNCLEAALDNIWEQARQSESAPLRHFRVVIPMYCGLEHHAVEEARFDLGHTLFRVRPFRSLEECVQCSLPDDAVFRFNTQGPNPTFVAEVEASAINGRRAALDTLRPFSLWRAAVNFVASRNSIHIQFVPSARSLLPPPPWLITVSDEEVAKVESVGIKVPGPIDAEMTGVREVSRGHMDGGTSLANSLSLDAADSSIQSLIVDALMLHCLASDQMLWHYAFMVLWQLAEKLAQIDGAKHRHDEVCRRLPMLAEPDHMGDYNARVTALEQMLTMRHDVVHRAAFNDVDSSDLDFLDRNCKEALGWVIRHAHDLPDQEHLRLYFQHALMTPVQRNRIGHVLGLISAKGQIVQGNEER